MSSAPSVTASDWLSPYPPPRSLPLDQEALRVYQCAYYLGDRVEDEGNPRITFTTLCAALLLCEDETSRWFAEQAKTRGPVAELVFAEKKKLTADVRREALAQPDPPTSTDIRLSSDKQLLTASSRAVLESAENWAQRVGGSDIGVRHLVASYVINPPAYHRDQLGKWRFDETSWRSVFFDWVAGRFTWEQWIDASQRAAPASSRVAFEQTQVKGKSLAWPGDERALGVLEYAAEKHRHRQDAWLGYSTLFFALVERARQDDETRAAVLPIWSAVERASETYLTARKQYFAEAPWTGQQTFAELDISPRVLNTLETARELATSAGARRRAGGESAKVAVLHLAGALVSPRVDAGAELTSLGLSLPDLRKALVAHAESLGETVQIWREMLGDEETLLTGRPVDLNSDEPEAVVRLDEQWASDPLAIRPDVEGFASLLASRDLEPPLSIGLFGPWGSGKTTFLKRLRRAVERHAKEAQKPDATHGPYAPNIVHVEFNAWHFSEDALISSLVDTTIRQIRAYVSNTPDLGPKEWLDEKLKELESRQRQVSAATDLHTAAVGAVAAAQTQLAECEREATERAASVTRALADVWTATTAEFARDPQVSGVVNAIGGTVNDVDELRQRVDRLRSRPGRMIGDLGWFTSALFVVIVLAVPLIVPMIVQRLTGAADFRQILAAVSAFIAVGGAWAKAASAAVAKVDKATAKVVAEYQRRIAEDESVKTAQRELAAAQGNAQTAAAALQASRAELARAQADAANASLPAQTLNLVSSRIDDRTYAKELTTLSVARADLEALSRILRAQRTDAAVANNGLRALDRVILYVDDLDRCKPEDVVRVLQLVHMLLAFELFVVVVAVDARWVEHALKQSYPWLKSVPSTIAQPGADADAVTSGALGHVTPEDYLEKIFQIAFWLEPMTAGRAASYLTSLVRPSATGTPLPATAPGGAPAPVQALKVDVSSVELDYMRALAAYVGSSPRRVKRLVNAYRLIKARLSDKQLAAFVTHSQEQGGKARSGPYQIVIGLLVIGTGSQAASSAILGTLGEWDPRAKYDEVIKTFRERNDPEWTAAAQVIETIMRTQNATDVAELRGWARKVGRFLLHGPVVEQRAAPTPSAVVH
jgi:hypothetical protein